MTPRRTVAGRIWRRRAKAFLENVFSPYDSGYGFLAARRCGTGRWIERGFAVKASHEIGAFLRQHSRSNCDLYFCPNPFERRTRKTACALPTRSAHVDIDDADPATFAPCPNVLVETSPGRYQGLWLLDRLVAPAEAQGISKMLAYRHGADKGGWSITKFLRIPHTFNHKPVYRRPNVKLIQANFEPQPARLLLALGSPCSDRHASKQVAIDPHLHDPAEVIGKYRHKLHPHTLFLLRRKKLDGLAKDRSKVIFEIVAGLSDAGASPNEIGAVLWLHPYFRSKRGEDQTALTTEINRIISKLAVKS